MCDNWIVEWVIRNLLPLLQFLMARNELGRVTLADLSAVMLQFKNFSELFTEKEIKAILSESDLNMDREIDYESFLQVSFWYGNYRDCFSFCSLGKNEMEWI